MFGIGGSEILVILIVALIFLGPDKLPDAAKQISKGIRDLKRGSRQIQQTIENDATIGGAIRDLKSALRGEDPPPRKNKIRKPIEIEADEPPIEASLHAGLTPPAPELPAAAPDSQLSLFGEAAKADAAAGPEPKLLPPEPAQVRLPPVAGDDARPASDEDRAELAALIKPASGTIAKGALADEQPTAEAPAAGTPASKPESHG